MTSLPTTAIATAEPGQEKTNVVLLAWSVHLARHQPKRLLRLAAALGAVLLAALCLFQSFWLALLPVVAVLLALSEFVFPTHYTLTEKSAAMRCGLTSLEIRWSEVRHAYLAGDGIKLSPLGTKNSRMEPLRGVFLRFDDSRREAIMDAVVRLRAEAQTHG